MGDKRQRDFISESSGARPTFLSELWMLLRDNKKWWMVPLILTIMVLALLVMLSSTAAAPFIYTLF